jgi:hypothetical protein
MEPKTIRRAAPTFFPGRCALFLLIALLGPMACGDGVTDPNGNDPDPPGPGEYDHARAPGASAADLLTADVFDRVIVQVQYVQGYEPSAAGLQHLEDFLEARLNKPAGITIQIDAPLPIAGQATYSAAEVRALEADHRTVFTEGTTLAMYALFLDGEFAGSPNVLGVAYNNTSLAIFEETIQAHSGGALEPSVATVEGTVAQHEAGHLLGLVNNGSAMQTEHQDEPNGHHCDDPNCLMYWAVRTTDFIQNLLDGMPQLDQDCLDDLQANGGA